MGSEPQNPLHIVFLPFPTPGHMIPMVDLARILASHGVQSTIITTPSNALLFQTSIAGDSPSGKLINTHLLDFPAGKVGLPAGVENFSSLTSPDMSSKLFYGLALLQNPTEDLIQELNPDCIISDMFYPWTSDFATQIGVPRLVFHSSSLFSLCCGHSVKIHAPHEQVASDADMVTLPSLPDKIEMRRSQLPEWSRTQNRYTLLMDAIKKAELNSYGIIANSFYDLEKAYEDYYKEATGLKIWTIGPVSLQADRGQNGNSLDSTTSPCLLEWLDHKEPRSVLYVSFGSLTKLPAHELKEIASGLESSGHNFIWAVKKTTKEDEDEDGDGWCCWDEGFMERMRETKKGFIIQGWAPQLLILEHRAIGAMVTHCGWNSIIEGINAGLPLITWPLFAEQFYNERLVVDVLRIGVAVGVTTWCQNVEDSSVKREIVRREKVEAAVKFVMGHGGEAVEMRRRVAELSEAAKRAVKISGSSRANLRAFIDELDTKRSNKPMCDENPGEIFVNKA